MLKAVAQYVRDEGLPRWPHIAALTCIKTKCATATAKYSWPRRLINVLSD
jgi:hypothetical protein